MDFVHIFIPRASNTSVPLQEMRKLKSVEKFGQVFKILHFAKCTNAVTKASTLGHPDTNAQVEK